MGTAWKPAGDNLYEGRDRKSGAVKWTAPAWIWCSAPTRNCGPSPRYTPRTTTVKFVRDFVRAWTKVMNLDRFDRRR
jgi:catalase-peroxidase